MTVMEAQACLPELVGRVQAGEVVTLTQDGKPVAELIRPDKLKLRHQLIREKQSADDMRSQVLGQTDLPAERAEELGRALRADVGER